MMNKKIKIRCRDYHDNWPSRSRFVSLDELPEFRGGLWRSRDLDFRPRDFSTDLDLRPLSRDLDLRARSPDLDLRVLSLDLRFLSRELDLFRSRDLDLLSRDLFLSLDLLLRLPLSLERDLWVRSDGFFFSGDLDNFLTTLSSLMAACFTGSVRINIPETF